MISAILLRQSYTLTFQSTIFNVLDNFYFLKTFCPLFIQTVKRFIYFVNNIFFSNIELVTTTWPIFTILTILIVITVIVM